MAGGRGRSWSRSTSAFRGGEDERPGTDRADGPRAAGDAVLLDALRDLGPRLARSWFIHSDDNGRTWTRPEPVPGRLANFTFIRNHIVTRDGRILIPFQHYLGPGPDVPPSAAGRAALARGCGTTSAIRGTACSSAAMEARPGRSMATSASRPTTVITAGRRTTSPSWPMAASP